MSAVRRSAESVADLAVVGAAFNGFVELTARYWLGVAEQMQRVR